MVKLKPEFTELTRKHLKPFFGFSKFGKLIAKNYYDHYDEIDHS